jgi:cytoskeleton protein RodZ
MATNNKTYPAFGPYLKRVRLEKGVRLEEVSKETRIGLEILLQIENQDHEHLPAEVFVKGFLRAYAKVIGADGDEAVRLYLESLQVYRDAAKSEDDLIKTSPKFWLRLLGSLGALCCIIIISIMVISFLQNAEYHEHPAEQEKVVEKAQRNLSETSQALQAVNKSSQIISKKLILNMITIKKTWVKVIIDDQAPREYTLKPGENMVLEAVSEFNLLIGNAAGVKLRLNDRPVEITGKNGQVVTVHLP